MIYFVVARGKAGVWTAKIQHCRSGESHILPKRRWCCRNRKLLYEELFYRKSDTMKLDASVSELCDRCYKNVRVRLTPSELCIDDEEF